ncbi:aminotransferase class III-fold pyridoxal phosphate-dependent enzyme [Flavobacteriaceae bacterium S0862]|nr:aminotransferase class III-fold pyridoxal phosphate-dependent enzyme [Flavobacteriaceae bacterium S0862]
MNYTDTKISIQEAEKILFEQYNIKGTAHPLPGYEDYNFRIKVDNEDGYVLKISRQNVNKNAISFLRDILLYLEKNSENLITPKIIADTKGDYISEVLDNDKNRRSVRLLTWISGRVWHEVNPRLNNLHFSLGETSGKITNTLQGFHHESIESDLDWDIAHSLWTKKHIHLFPKEEQEIVSYFQNRFENELSTYTRLRKSIVHNDVNDYNILVSDNLINPKVKAVIDYGDAMQTHIINDVGICCAYAIMRQNDSLEPALQIVSGYHSVFPLQEEELDHLHTIIAMRLIVSYTSALINLKKEPENIYLQVSAKPASEALKKWFNISSDFAHYSFRVACGYTAHPDTEKFNRWASTYHFKVSELFPTAPSDDFQHIDLSVSSKWIGHQENFNDLDLFQFKIDKLQAEYPNKVLAGGYLEPRPIYTSTAYDKIGNNGRESRTIHLGIDFWFHANTPIHALFDGEVVTACNDAGDKEYGGLVILKHRVEDFEFYTLYGHNTVESATKHQIGDLIKKGEKIAELGNYPENGNWAPHLHFQVMMSMLDYEVDFPGVTYFKQLNVWKGLCPDPNLLFKSEALKNSNNITNAELIAYRKQHLGKSLSLQYKTPIKMVRGAGVYLMDQYAQKYLDTVNNVAHVGHEHYDVVKAGQEQMALINTNSRYLHDNINELAKELIETLPPELNVLHFVNSGSEANELAIRMAKAYSGEKDIVASEVGYHGNTNMCVDISSYKFDGKGGQGAPEHTHIFPIPNAFRGKYRGKNTADKYAEEVKQCIDNIQSKGRNVAAFIIEPIISCGGQVELPQGFLPKAYKLIREAGGICISDEVQTGCGRMGKTFWGFQLHNVVPDIVTIGKPLGNGHPVAAVACTKEIADKFANGMEYFNTFGGNPVSCTIATEVLRVVKREKLQENALEVGEFLKEELKKLSNEYPIIGNVRGQGLFLGIEFVDNNLNPLAEQTDYLANRMKDHGILMSIDGPDHNVLKIKPPIVFSKENAKELLFYLRKILAEDFMKTR